jgi:riboflavin synthase
MFTGIVRELGRLEARDGGAERTRLRIRAPRTAETAAVGDSVAVNGVCLTAVAVADGAIAFDAVPETLARSALGGLEPGDALNVEPAVRAGDPLGGHMVQGHVDGVGRVVSVDPEGDGKRLTLAIPAELERFCVEKGSITVDGVSVTIAALAGRRVEVALVPHTIDATTLGALAPGAAVNIEADVLAKHVERLLDSRGRLQ